MEDELLSEFREEALENLEQAEGVLLKLDQGEFNEEAYNLLFRSIHSAKGGAGMFNLLELQSIMHHLETLIGKRKGKDFPQKLVDYLLSGVDMCRSVLDGESGANFQLIDPMQETPAPKKETMAKQEPKSLEHILTQAVIYVVDDEPSIVSSLVDSLSKNGFQAHGFHSAQEVLDRLSGSPKNETPQIIISDIKMPEMSGLQMIDRIHKIDPGIHFVFMSAYLTKSLCVECVQKGAAHIFEKPFQNLELLTVIEAILQKHQALRLFRELSRFFLFQYSDLDAYLEQSGKDWLRLEMKTKFSEIWSTYNKIFREQKEEEPSDQGELNVS